MLNEQQEFVRQQAMKWWNSSEQIFQYTGGPGTGKTYLLHHILQSIGVDPERIAPMAYTGQAAIVMRGNGLPNARTIHSSLYETVETYEKNPDGTYKRDPYFNKPITRLEFVPRDLEGIDLFILDEGSMIPVEMAKEINSRGKKIIVTGDLDQLPPVFGDSGYLVSGTIYKLTEIMRQQRNSPIVYLSQLALQGKPIQRGIYGNCKVVYEKELTDYEIIHSDIMICGKNVTRDMINNNYRHNIIRTNSTVPLEGERLVCRKNNWNIGTPDGLNLANGLIGTVIKQPDVSSVSDKSYTIDFLPFMGEHPFYDLLCDYKYLNASTEERKILKNAKYSIGEKMEYAYAITTHMSQGGQFNNGIYVEEHLGRNLQRALNYTGITRFKNSLIYVIPEPKYYYNIPY